MSYPCGACDLSQAHKCKRKTIREYGGGTVALCWYRIEGWQGIKIRKDHAHLAKMTYIEKSSLIWCSYYTAQKFEHFAGFREDGLHLWPSLLYS